MATHSHLDSSIMKKKHLLQKCRCTELLTIKYAPHKYTKHKLCLLLAKRPLPNGLTLALCAPGLCGPLKAPSSDQMPLWQIQGVFSRNESAKEKDRAEEEKKKKERERKNPLKGSPACTLELDLIIFFLFCLWNAEVVVKIPHQWTVIKRFRLHTWRWPDMANLNIWKLKCTTGQLASNAGFCGYLLSGEWLVQYGKVLTVAILVSYLAYW